MMLAAAESATSRARRGANMFSREYFESRNNGSQIENGDRQVAISRK
jgi:hypothetical protein